MTGWQMLGAALLTSLALGILAMLAEDGLLWPFIRTLLFGAFIIAVFFVGVALLVGELP